MHHFLSAFLCADQPRGGFAVLHSKGKKRVAKNGTADASGRPLGWPIKRYIAKDVMPWTKPFHLYSFYYYFHCYYCFFFF